MRDLWRPGGGSSRMTWRHFGALLDRLSPESAYHTAVANDVGADELAKAKPATGRFGAWSHEAHLLAAAVDRLGAVEAAVYASVGVKGAKPPPPIPRPGVPPVAARAEASTEQRAALEAYRQQVKAAQRAARDKAKTEGGNHG